MTTLFLKSFISIVYFKLQRIVGHVYAAGERRLRHGMQADVVGHVREVGLARGDAGDERKGLGHVEMGIMLRKAERVDDEHLHAPEFFDLGIPDGLEIGPPCRYGSP